MILKMCDWYWYWCDAIEVVFPAKLVLSMKLNLGSGIKLAVYDLFIRENILQTITYTATVTINHQ